MSLKEHWEKVYREKRPDQVSWWQEHPKTSLDFIHSLHLSKTARIIDIGGGDSKLVDCLLDEGFEDITVLDISRHAIERAKLRLGGRAQRVQWIESDVIEFRTEKTFDLWHDRAAFHFLNSAQSIEEYISLARESIKNGGFLILATFSTDGPKSCSALPVHQYDDHSLASALQNGFDKVKCITEDHTTPFGTTQNFLYCSFRRHSKR